MIKSQIPAASRSLDIPFSRIREIFDMASQHEGMIRLDVGEPNFNTPANIIEAAIKALKEGYTHYTPNAGLPGLREAIAEKLSNENSIPIASYKQVAVTPGGINALYLALLATVNPGEELLVPDPSWTQYISMVKLAGGIPIPYSLKEENEFQIDLDELQEMTNEKTRAILVNSPCNPTGAVWDRQRVEQCVRFAEQNDLVIISDEIYDKIIFDDFIHVSFAAIPNAFPRTLTINGFSKTYAMTGWRLGYVAGPKEIIEQITKISQNVVTSANAAAQCAGIEALRGSQDAVHLMIERYQKRRDLIWNGLNNIAGIRCNKPRGAFYAFANISSLGMSSWDFTRFLIEKARVSTVPGKAFGASGEGFIRLSFANSSRNIEEAIERIRNELEA